MDILKVIIVLTMMMIFHDFIYEDEVVGNNYVVIEMRK